MMSSSTILSLLSAEGEETTTAAAIPQLPEAFALASVRHQSHNLHAQPQYEQKEPEAKLELPSKPQEGLTQRTGDLFAHTGAFSASRRVQRRKPSTNYSSHMDEYKAPPMVDLDADTDLEPESSDSDDENKPKCKFCTF